MVLKKIFESLSVDQKLAQFTSQGSPDYFVKDGKFDSEKARRDYPNGIGGMMVPIDLTPVEIGEWVCEMRKCFAELSPVLLQHHKKINATMSNIL